MTRPDLVHLTDLDDLPPPTGPYSQVVAVGDLVFTAGFGPQDPTTGAVADGIAAQTRQVLHNILAALAHRGLDGSDIVKATVHLQHLDRDFAEFNAAYREVLAAPYPVRTTVGSRLPGILVEVDVIAAARPAPSTP